nr:PIG-L family deacetylase [Sporomusa silvacetica]
MSGIVVCIGLLFFGIYQIYFYYQEKPEVNVALPSISLVPDQTRMLVIAPHCDDEVLGCAGTIQEVIGAGGQVMVVTMTNGDGFTFAVEEQVHQIFLTRDDYIQSGYARQNELLRALHRLGMDEKQIAFLGYPDRGLRALWTDYWDKGQPYQSRYTGKDHSPYSNSYQPNTPYAGEAVMDDLEAIIREFKPNVIFSPHPADEHPDHAATWSFISAVVTKVANNGILPKPKLYTYLVHRGDFPIPHGYSPEAALLPPKPLYYYSYSRQWQVYTLTSEQESIKENALNEYVSQLRVPIMSSLLRSFIRRNELFEEVDIPAAVSQTSDLELAEINTWENQQPILVYPKSVSVLGALARQARVEALACAVQDTSLWFRFYIPGFSEHHNQYQVLVISFQLNKGTLTRAKRTFSFSTSSTDVVQENIKRLNEDVIIKIPFADQELPDYFLIQILTKDRWGVTIDHTAWQQIQIKHSQMPN